MILFIYQTILLTSEEQSVEQKERCESVSHKNDSMQRGEFSSFEVKMVGEFEPGLDN